MQNKSANNDSLPLLPHRARYAGYVLMLLSLGAGYLYFIGGRPSFFEVPVFAVVTSYAETRWFVIAQTNALDEMAFVFAVLGLTFIAFSKQKTENEFTHEARIKALFYSVYFAAGLWVVLYLIVFGWPVIIVSTTIFILFLLSYIVIFHLQLKKIKHLNRNIK